MAEELERALNEFIAVIQERDAAAARGEKAKTAAERRAAAERAAALAQWAKNREAIKAACRMTNDHLKRIGVEVRFSDIELIDGNDTSDANDVARLARAELAIYRFGHETDLTATIEVEPNGNQWVESETFPNGPRTHLPNMARCGQHEYQVLINEFLESVIDQLPTAGGSGS